ncbi:unnamed protein product [Vitrella brassicaformis CCMP3155]|uniref:Uncharacterized protein n=1 Tax=Vitrella brassicaformis (strain CCMP3155) TaxID=1169540 RepID=A0A0G4F8I8_VITBC|nr:unnamed protein product [Vitrella brassicaformis CCMP3155]|eukprot:CEM08687.1 unnamed protein product [Vitrella brassicaformis CCMP3155]
MSSPQFGASDHIVTPSHPHTAQILAGGNEHHAPAARNGPVKAGSEQQAPSASVPRPDPVSHEVPHEPHGGMLHIGQDPPIDGLPPHSEEGESALRALASDPTTRSLMALLTKKETRIRELEAENSRLRRAIGGKTAPEGEAAQGAVVERLAALELGVSAIWSHLSGGKPLPGDGPRSDASAVSTLEGTFGGTFRA